MKKCKILEISISKELYQNLLKLNRRNNKNYKTNLII